MSESRQSFSPAEINPLKSLDQWEDFVLECYPEPETIATAKATGEYRNYEEPGRDTVREFYRLNHTYVDDSDPDTDLDQFQHLLQTSEAIRKDGHPDWMVLTGLMHDMGKVLCLFGEPQWAVVGDTFPVGCAYSDKIVYPEFFKNNPDFNNPAYNTQLGVYEEGCGLRNVHMSWGHDEYVYQMMKDYIPEPGLYMLRYHSFYAWHREGEYQYLLDDHDRDMLKWVNLFNPYDLYSKNPEVPVWSELKSYYEDLIGKYLPATLKF